MFSGGPIAQIIYAGTKLFTVVWPLLAWRLLERGPRQTGRLRLSQHLRSIPVGLVSGLMIGGAVVVAYLGTPLGNYVLSFSEVVRQKVVELGVQEHYVPFAVFLSLGHSLLEEYYWRWYVFGRLSRVVPVAAAFVVGSVAFTAHHVVILSTYFSMPGVALFSTGVAVGGLVWCWQFQRSGSLLGCWVSHAMVDAAVLSVGYRLISHTV
jgi:hypothetical protein